MKAKEFYEKYKGKYFTYDCEKVKVVGYEIDSDFIIFSGYSEGHHLILEPYSYVCEELIDVSDLLYYCSIYDKPFCQFIESDETEIQPCIEYTAEPISKRFHAACCAMQGLLANPFYNMNSLSVQSIVITSYELAEELLKQENDGKALQ